MHLLPLHFKSRQTGGLFFLAAAVLALTGRPLQADSLVWDASGANPNQPVDGVGNWDTTSTNQVWSDLSTVPNGQAQDSAWNNAAGNIAVFGNQVAGAQIKIDNGNVTAAGLVFDDTANNPNLGYVIQDGGNGANTLTLTGPASTITTNANAQIAVILAGTSGFTKDGTGSLTLSAGASGMGTNLYTGTTTVKNGTLVLVGSGSMGTVITGDLVVNAAGVVEDARQDLIATTSHVTVNGGLIIGGQSGPGGSATQTLAGISGTGSVQGNLTLNLAQSQTFGGTFAGNLTISAATTAITETLSQTPAANSFTMNGGTLSVAGISSSQTTLTLNGGNFRYTGSASNNSLGLLLGQGGGALDSSGTGALNVVNAGFSSSSGSGPRTLTLTGNSTAANTLIGDLSGSSSPTTLVKNGTGTWILSQNNGSYAGGTQINQGTLELGDSSRLGVGPVAINASGTLVITGPSFSNVSNLVAGGGTLILDNPVSVVFNGLVRSNGGGLVIVPLNPVALGVSEHVGFVGSPPTVTNGIIDASVVAANSATDTSADFLGYDTNNGLVRATYSTATAIANGGTNGTTAASVYHATGANNNVVSASSQIYALKVDSGVVVGGSSMLTIGDGVHTAGVILGGNAQGAPASIFAPINFGTSEASIYVGGSGTNLYATIGNRVIGSNGLTKNGNGFLEISDAEYSGPTTVNEGTLQLDLAGSNVVGGNTTINLAATLLFGNTAGPVNSTINLTSDGTIGASSKNSGGIQLAGTINGNGHALTVQSSETAQTVAFFGKATNLSQINVTEGALLLNGQTLAGDSTVNVGSSTPGVFGILEGAASVGQINLGANGVLRPGDGLASPVLNATGLAWNSANSELIFDLGATSNASTQLDLGSGALTKGTGSDFVFDFELGGEAGQSYTLITFGLDNTNFQASDFVAEGVDGTFSMVDDGDFESVIFTEEVPEPGTTGLMVFGAGGIMALACRKRPCVTKGNQETHIA